MPSGLLTMSDKEIERVTVIKQIANKRLKQRHGAKLLGLSTRQIIRLVKKYRREGAAGLVSTRRGHISNRYKGDQFKTQVEQLVRQHYYDFGPTFAAEKLFEIHQLKIGKERLRHWMMEWKLWRAKHEKINIHQTRERRSCFGELVQIDGSHHKWFEERGPKCCLLVFIDDATSKIVGLRFEEQETTAGYFKLTRQYIEQYGRPLAFYSDKDSIFRVNMPDCEDAETQFGRAVRELGIESICANSPQAKGRVERANNTLQKRLVRELRLRGINDIKSANAYLPEYLNDHNKRFAKEARDAFDKHRSYLPLKEMLDLIFTFQEERTLSKNLEFSYQNLIYQVQGVGVGRRLQHKKVMVCENLNGQITLLQEGHRLEYKTINKQHQAAKIVPLKQLDEALDHRGQHHHKPPASNHPWRQYKNTTGIVYGR
jgi:transposase